MGGKFSRWVGLVAGFGVLAGLGGGLVAPGVGSTAVAAGPTKPPIAVLPDLPEPEFAQFEEGKSNVVPPTAVAAKDITTAAPRRAADGKLVAGSYTCPGFSGIDTPNPVANLLNDTYTWGPYAPYKVGNGSGNINWRLNPYKNPSWYMWLHSLRWLGQGIVAASTGDTTAMDRVTTIVRDWVTDNPYSWKADVGAYEATMHRTNVLICVRQAVISGLGVTTLPAAYSWLDTALTQHATFLINNWSGAWNHGTDESIALFGIGCTLNRADYKTTAQTRLAQGITTSIDSQGSTNEQSTAYAQFNYSLWGRAVTVLQQCGADPGTTINTRRALMANWLALATNSLGKYAQIGDSEVVATNPYAGTPMEYAGTKGASGTPSADRVKVYNAGYVFGRTGWGQTRPFTQESAYSIRFGPGRAVHGHSDHMGITYTAKGRDILINGGHAGYQNDVWRTWAKGQFSANSMTTPLSAETLPVTKLNRQVVKANAEFFEFTDVPGSGISRTRGYLVLKDPDLIVSLDRATSKTAQQFQTLWHMPSDQKATVYSRTTAIAAKAGDTSRTILFQVPFRQALPAGAILIKQAQTNPIQGWHYPNIFTRNSAPTLMFARSGYSSSILSFIAPVKATGSVTYKGRWSGTTYVIDLVVAGVKTSVGITSGGALFRAA
ncbi:heparinase II/III family protein [Kribbella sp. VKM Ac-2568]|uniref:heparinase II/III domain-containing protein n=1 Tax=Kribbella sp. VKM Ac-2568 TaxID=2512219 RepID=UPI00104CDB32|nr:heparinase II/III family protein [Kribbella sp. VKM Ac-2568]TCM51434.1 heparinase II/III-like protein [Kribbella sp. VKM Ac-2568]